jgi:acetyl-CoA carboxylase biotin carboxyl carrier protein
MNKVTPADVESLVELFDASDWKELNLELDGFEIHLSKDPASRMGRADAVPPAASVPRPSSSTAVPNVPAASPAVAAGVDPSWIAVRAPNLGTFSRAPKPGAAPFVEAGQAVTADTELCLIEVMKLFTVLRAGVAGTVRRICASDAELIEHGQVLFYVEPAR